MRLPLTALAGLTLLASFAHAQLSATVAPITSFATSPAVGSASQLPPAPTVGSDVCTTAEVLGMGVGAFGFDLTAATTGAEGQTSFLGGDNCNYGCAEYGTGNVQVPGDVWFSWVAPSSNRVRITTCPMQPGQDPKIAVYNGPTCPTGTTCIACNDDWHGFQAAAGGYQRDSMLYFDAIAGAPYLIQVGRGLSLFTAGGFVGTMNIEVGPLPRPTDLDDGNAEVSFSVGALNNGNCRMQRFGNVGDVTTVTSTDMTWGWAGQVGLVNGTPCVVAIWEDLNQDGNPNDAVLKQQVATTMQNVSTGTFVNIPFTPPVTVNGIYFIGDATQLIACATCNMGVDQPMTADTSSCETQPDTAWYGVNTAAPYDVTNPAGNTFPSTRIGQNCQAAGTATYNGLYHSSWTIHSNVLAGPAPVGTGECFGDTAAMCPCSSSGGSGTPNPGAVGHGCQNTGNGPTPLSSEWPSGPGALLTATGNPSEDLANGHAADTVVLSCANMTGPGLFIQSNGLVGPLINFNDGALCAAAGILRLGVSFPGGVNPPGVGTYPNPTAPAKISVAGSPVLLNGLPTASTKHYQCWYRDVFTFCNPIGHNMSNGLAIVWVP